MIEPIVFYDLENFKFKTQKLDEYYAYLVAAKFPKMFIHLLKKMLDEKSENRIGLMDL